MDASATNRDSITPSQKSLAQTLPHDVLCELYKTLAKYDPPTRKRSRAWANALNLQQDAPTESLSPGWTTRAMERYRRESDFHPAVVSSSRFMASESNIGWIRLTHVCAHWRAVGLSLARMWGDILPIFPCAIETILARSRDTPLSFDMDIIGYVGPHHSSLMLAFFNLAKQHLARAQTVTFPYNVRGDWEPSVLRGAHMPHLKTLRVQSLRDVDWPADTFLHAPLLSHLVLDAFALSLIVPSLRYLKITKEAEPLKTVSLLNVLRSLPLLEELILEWATAPEVVTSSATISLVPLPNLAFAEFCAPPPLLSFVKYLDIPHDAELSFFVWYRPEVDGSILPLLDDLSPRLRHQSIDCISFNPGGAVEVCLGSTHTPSGEPAPRIFIRSNGTSVAEDCGSLAGFLSHIVARMEPVNIVSLYANSTTNDLSVSEHAPVYASILHQLQNLSTLSPTWRPAQYHPFLTALRSPSTSNTLKNLIIFSGDTLVGYDIFAAPERVVEPAIDGVRRRWEDILSILDERENAGVRLERLVLKGVRNDEGWFGMVNATRLSRAAQLVGEVVDERTSGSM
ncbi:hypothetical protein PENSPDRAFT_750196 [Peniophora sp. CONT]|nr:hypothetical protein PENSPDRAFT_750196 [Peniophora sp. CONT]